MKKALFAAAAATVFVTVLAEQGRSVYPSAGNSAVLSSTIASPTVVNSGGRPLMTKTDFDQEFADVATVSDSANTAANREKLREFGWRLINQQ